MLVNPAGQFLGPSGSQNRTVASNCSHWVLGKHSMSLCEMYRYGHHKGSLSGTNTHLGMECTILDLTLCLQLHHAKRRDGPV